MAITILPPYTSDEDSDDNSNTSFASASSRSSPIQEDSDLDPNSVDPQSTRTNTARPRKRLKTSSNRNNHKISDDNDGDKSNNPYLTSQGLSTSRILVPGEVITTESQWMRGHGTHSSQQPSNASNTTTTPYITATLPGPLTITNKLLSITPLRTRYTPSIGDLVIGRISSLDRNRWRVDIGAPLLAQLPLSSINLPGGVLRRKTTADELQMRRFLREGEVVVAEVQSVGGVDGVGVLHTRSLKYGKLRNGVFLVVGGSGGGSGGGVIRGKRQVFTVDTAISTALAATAGSSGVGDSDIGNDGHAGDVEVTLGVNGFIWVGRPVDNNHEQQSTTNANATTPKTPRSTFATNTTPTSATNPSISNLDDVVSNAIYSSQNDTVNPATRIEIARLCSCITLLADAAVRVDEDTVTRAYRAAVEAEMERVLMDGDDDGDGMDVDGNGGFDPDLDLDLDGGGLGSSSRRKKTGEGGKKGPNIAERVDRKRILQAVLLY